jgi:hypothetical protein
MMRLLIQNVKQPLNEGDETLVRRVAAQCGIDEALIKAHVSNAARWTRAKSRTRIS